MRSCIPQTLAWLQVLPVPTRFCLHVLTYLFLGKPNLVVVQIVVVLEVQVMLMTLKADGTYVHSSVERILKLRSIIRLPS